MCLMFNICIHICIYVYIYMYIYISTQVTPRKLLAARKRKAELAAGETPGLNCSRTIKSDRSQLLIGSLRKRSRMC